MDIIKPSELQIGDLVDIFGNIQKVTCIKEMCYATKSKGGNAWSYNNIYKPIPLTDKIMELNKFNGMSYTYYDGYNVALHNLANVITVGPLVYVHELQNTMRLCGLSERANNFKVKEEDS